jgi:hypothetical protein
MSWQKLGDVAQDVVRRVDPKVFIVTVRSDIAVKVEAYAASQHVKPETIIAEAVAAYMGDAA